MTIFVDNLAHGHALDYILACTIYCPKPKGVSYQVSEYRLLA